ncbi:hypothetical protein POM88_020816 [Heracleum sosnowskyi]|uniref:Uncharacterized protein n=1 Tax=Heracleum sosnowskyi TaxID=360622 RepID=A0AAD8IDN5_9APIA|nr:hypothetical protein POM88_020816 [Heracleum sosnowskyi]
MAVTTHFIDDSWTLQSCILRFIYVPCPHTKEVLADHLLECLMDWNLDRKLSCLTVDNCTTNDAMIEILLEKLDSSSLIAGEASIGYATIYNDIEVEDSCITREV